jgi:hypothetical protein
MGKKRQFTGKTTKLARLPLTLALAEQSEVSGGGAAAVAAARETTEPLGAIYIHLIRELSFLLSQLQAGPQTPVPPPRALLPPHVPQPQQIRKSLRLAQQGLQDLQFLLSRP